MTTSQVFLEAGINILGLFYLNNLMKVTKFNFSIHILYFKSEFEKQTTYLIFL